MFSPRVASIIRRDDSSALARCETNPKPGRAAAMLRYSSAVAVPCAGIGARASLTVLSGFKRISVEGTSKHRLRYVM
jgi:hypothetical protein